MKPELLELVTSNSYKCSVVTYVNGTYRRSLIELDESKDSVLSLGLFRYLRWDKKENRKLVQAACVVPTTAAANRQAFLYLTSYARGSDPRVPFSWESGSIDCSYNSATDVLSCEGVSCGRFMASQVGDGGNVVQFSGGDFYCENGCTIAGDFSYYDCGDGGGGGGEGGGGTGGGGGGGGGEDPPGGGGGGSTLSCPADWSLEGGVCFPHPGMPGSEDPETWAPPYGVPQHQWEKLSRGEWALVFSEPLKWIPRIAEMFGIRDYAISQSLILTGQDRDIDGTKQNAIQHAIWAGTMAAYYGYNDAKAWTDAHEDNPVPLFMTLERFNALKEMDLHNNGIGLDWSRLDPPGSETLNGWIMNRQHLLRCVLDGGTTVTAC